jgi:hypothetical protein
LHAYSLTLAGSVPIDRRCSDPRRKPHHEAQHDQLQGSRYRNPTFRSTTLSLSPREQVHADFFYGHGQFSPTTYRKIATACDWAAKETSAACNAALDTMSEEIGGYNV